MGNRRTGCCRCGRPRRGLGLAANDDRVGGAHPLLRSVLLGRGRRRRSASGDPGVGARRTRVPAAMAGGYDGVRGRSASGARVQGSNARRLGCPADRGSADGAGRPASRLARCAAPRRLRCGRAGRVDRRGFVRIPSPGRAESSAGPRHRLERAREPAGPRGLPRFCGSGFRSGGRDDPHRDPRLARAWLSSGHLGTHTMPAPATRCPATWTTTDGARWGPPPRSCWPPTICPRRPPFPLDWRTDPITGPVFWGDREAACGFWR